MSPDRRAVLGGMLAMAGGKAADPQVPGGNHPMRPDQALNATHKTRSLSPGAQSGLIRAQIIIVSGGTASGVFIYNGKPAPGNPPIISATNGTKDPFGNTVIPGVATYFGSPVITARLFSGAVFFAEQGTTNIEGSIGIGGVSPSSQAVVIQSGNVVPGTAQGILSVFDAGSGVVAGVPLIDHNGTVRVSAASGSGQLLVVTNTAGSASKPMVQWNGLNAADAILGIDVTGDTFNRFKIDTNGLHQWGSGSAGQDVDLFRGAANLLQTDDSLAFTNSGAIGALAGAAILTAANGQMQSVNASGLNYNLTVAQPANFNKNTVTGAAFANLSTFNIPSGDPIVGAVYTFDVFGYGQWGSTQTQLTLQATIGGNQFALTAIAATAFAASAVFQWNARLTVACTATGVGGTWRCSLSGALQQTANALNPGAAASNSVAFSLGEGSAADIAGPTNASLAVQLLAEWASAANAATITKSVSYPARIA